MNSLGASLGYSLSLVTGPTEEPVTVADAKANSRVSHDADDSLFELWISAARRLIEEEASVRLVNQTWKLELHDWPGYCRSAHLWGSGGLLNENGYSDRGPTMPMIELPIEPIQSVTSLKYIDAGGTLQTLTEGVDYLTALNRHPPVVYCYPNKAWPVVAVGRLDAVQLTFVTGFGATAANVPETAKAAILLAVGYWDSNRGDEEDPTKLGLPPGALRLIRLLDFGGYR